MEEKRWILEAFAWRRQATTHKHTCEREDVFDETCDVTSEFAVLRIGNRASGSDNPTHAGVGAKRVEGNFVARAIRAVPTQKLLSALIHILPFLLF